jgi:bacterioferritin
MSFISSELTCDDEGESMHTKEDLIEGLNEDLMAELGTVIRYTYQAGHSFGFWGLKLRELFAGEIQDELGHAAFLTDAIVDLGGEPTTTPKPFEKTTTLREMLELDISMELQDVEEYTKHAELAGELGEVELKLKLEEMAADEAGHARELRRILKGF